MVPQHLRWINCTSNSLGGRERGGAKKVQGGAEKVEFVASTPSC